MKDSRDAARPAPPENRRSRLFWSGSAVDACELKSTLEGYEVEELACHDLARFLPTLVLGEESDEPEATGPQRT